MQSQPIKRRRNEDRRKWLDKATQGAERTSEYIYSGNEIVSSEYDTERDIKWDAYSKLYDVKANILEQINRTRKWRRGFSYCEEEEEAWKVPKKPNSKLLRVYGASETPDNEFTRQKIGNIDTDSLTRRMDQYALNRREREGKSIKKPLKCIHRRWAGRTAVDGTKGRRWWW
ncbi:hypothetical protein R3P38DRAFT_2760874 [Favolaschia claudopus]|uniref:Uncharacterized protein n=1 Tax=Favolaschia claudopus TaxID=2862362 RepID=A0AAW0DWF2_9AGAR